MKKILCPVLICLIVPFVSVQRVFAEPQNPDLPFTDVVIDQLVDITSSVSTSWLKTIAETKLVFDEVLIETTQGQFTTLYPSSNTLMITGTYHDNTITGLQQCSSSSYNYSTQNHTVDGVVVVETEFGTGLQHSSQNIFLAAALDVSTNIGASETVTTNSFTNTTEACALMGMNTGDKGVDGTTLLQLGYEQHTVTYNDGTSAGHTATVYVPGNESINLSIDASYINNLVNNIVINFIQDAVWFYHKEYSLYLTANQGYYVPEYGVINSLSYFNNIFDPSVVNTSNITAVFDPDLSYSGVTASYNSIFSYHTGTVGNTSNVYDRNYFKLSWQGTDEPYWKFTEPRQSISLSLNNAFLDSIYVRTDEDALSRQLYTISSSDVSEDSSLIQGNKLSIYSGFGDYHFYKLQDSGRLGLFNQLGTFLNNWFTRIKGSIDSISGNSDIVQEIENDYNIDFDTSIENYIQNIQNTSQNIDLTAPENNLPSDLHLNNFAPIVSETIKVFTDNNLWIIIFVPIIVALLGMIL